MTEQASRSEGGVEWEASTAWAAAIAARLQGDIEAETLAMNRWSQAQTNASIALVGQVIRPLASQIATTASDQERRFTYLLDQLSVFLDKEDKRHDALAIERDQVFAALEETRLQSKKALSIAEESRLISEAAITRVVALETNGIPKEAHDRLKRLEMQMYLLIGLLVLWTLIGLLR